MTTFVSASRVLDDTDIAILGELQADARMSWSELGRRVALSAPAVTERVRRLEDAGVITGYRADVDPAAAGYGVTAFIRLALLANRTYNAFTEYALATPEILECHHLTGEDCMIAKVVARSVRDLEDVIRDLSRFGRTTTSIVLSSPVEHRGVVAG